MQRGFKGIWIPKEIWLSPDLNYVEKILLVEIDSLEMRKVVMPAMSISLNF